MLASSPPFTMPPATFVHGPRPKTERISHEKWEQNREVLIENYEKMPLVDLQKYMAREHNFPATIRQLGHRLREVWKVKKYKVDKEDCQPQGSPVPKHPVLLDKSKSNTNRAPCPTPPPPSAPLPYASPGSILLFRPPDYRPVVISEDARRRLLLLAAILRPFGDDHHAHGIYTTLWDAAEPEPSIIDCVRTAQTIEQAEVARRLIEDLDEIPNEEAERTSWRGVLRDYLHAHTYNWGEDFGDALAQIEVLIGDIVVEDTQGRAILKSLDLRDGLPLDVLVYSSLASALVKYNKITDPQHEQPEFVEDILGQFLKQQPAFASDHSLQQIDCVPSCLEWCRYALEKGLFIPAYISTDGSDNTSSTTEARTLLCGLWYSWIRDALPSLLSAAHLQAPASHGGSPSSSGIPSWALTAQAQLGISATELLSTVVWMIMAAAAATAQPDAPSSSHPSTSTASASSSSTTSSFSTNTTTTTTAAPPPSSPQPLVPLARAAATAALTATKTLLSLPRRALTRCFLDQVWATDRRDIVQPCKEVRGYDGGIVRVHTGPGCCCGRGSEVGIGGGDARVGSEIEPFRRFVAGVLGVGGLPVLPLLGGGGGLEGMEGGVDGDGDVEMGIDPNLDVGMVGVEVGGEEVGGYGEFLGAQVNGV